MSEDTEPYFIDTGAAVDACRIHQPSGNVKRIHVNGHVLKANKGVAAADKKPPITVKTSSSNEYGSRVSILDERGVVVAVVVYRPDSPLSCGAECWVETKNAVVVE